MAGRGGVPATEVGAVAITLFAIGPGAAGHLDAYADGTPAPGVSNVNFVTGHDASNTAVVPVGPDGSIRITNTSWGAVGVAADVTGFFRTGSGPGGFKAVTPARLLDTRLGAGLPIGPGGRRAVAVTGFGGLPRSAVAAVVVNLTVTRPTASGYLTAYPSGTPPPRTSTLNFHSGQTVANLAILPVGADGSILLANASAGSVQAVADVFGYVAAGPAEAGGFTAVNPIRVLDTRVGWGAAPVSAGGTRTVPVTGVAGIPAGVAAVAVNLTVTAATDSGYLTGYADGAARPHAANLGVASGVTAAQFALLPVGLDGRIALTNNTAGTAYVVVDVTGYVLAEAPAFAVHGFRAPLPADTAASAATTLDSVSCAAAVCAAVGHYLDRLGQSTALIEMSADGITWTAVRPRLPAGAVAGPSELTSVSCVDPDWCVAVGSYHDTVDRVPLVELLRGGAWTPLSATAVQARPDVKAVGNLESVACSDRDTCIAVGEYEFGLDGPSNVVLQWSGGRFSADPSMMFGWNELISDPSCFAPGSCVVVHFDGNPENVTDSTVDTLAAGRWSSSLVQIPDQASTLADDVGCAQAGLCVATGVSVLDNDLAPFVAVNRSGVWTSADPVRSLLPGQPDDGTSTAVGCAESSCLTVGEVDLPDGRIWRTVRAWTGSGWDEVRVPVPGDSEAPSTSLTWTRPACPSDRFCGAAGSYLDTLGRVQGVLLHLVGGTWWTAPAVPGPVAGFDPAVSLTQTSCSARLCVSIGTYLATVGRQGLIETSPGAE